MKSDVSLVSFQVSFSLQWEAIEEHIGQYNKIPKIFSLPVGKSRLLLNLMLWFNELTTLVDLLYTIIVGEAFTFFLSVGFFPSFLATGDDPNKCLFVVVFFFSNKLRHFPVPNKIDNRLQKQHIIFEVMMVMKSLYELENNTVNSCV